jgi:hypothetical protein
MVTELLAYLPEILIAFFVAGLTIFIMKLVGLIIRLLSD